LFNGMVGLLRFSLCPCVQGGLDFLPLLVV
jgi:hypothetical protein